MEYIGLTLHDKQKEIADDIIQSSAKYFVINASRQSGKSVLMSQLLLFFGINESNKDICYITPTFKLAKKFYKNIIKGVKGSGVVTKANESNLSIIFKNDTEVTFMSAERYDNIRGGSYDYVFLDEFSFFKHGAWEAIKPTIASRKKAKVVISSTPKGKNLFHQLAMLGVSDNVRYKYYFMHYTDNPMYDLEEVEDARKVLADTIFRTEYEAEFLDDGGEVFKDISRLQTITSFSEPLPNMQYFAGVDWGKQTDSTVVHILDANGKTVHILTINQVSYTIILQKVAEILSKFNALAMVETNGIGDPLFDGLIALYPRLIAWTNTNKVKQDMIESLILGFADDKITLPTKELHKPLDFQISVFTYEYNPKTRSIRYMAQEPHHDDEIISLGLAYKCLSENKFTGNYMSYTPQNKFDY